MSEILADGSFVRFDVLYVGEVAALPRAHAAVFACRDLRVIIRAARLVGEAAKVSRYSIRPQTMLAIKVP